MTTKYQRRHYEDVARILKSEFPHPIAGVPRIYARQEWGAFHTQFVNLFADDNNEFDWERFNTACGLVDA